LFCRPVKTVRAPVPAVQNHCPKDIAANFTIAILLMNSINTLRHGGMFPSM